MNIENDTTGIPSQAAQPNIERREGKRSKPTNRPRKRTRKRKSIKLEAGVFILDWYAAQAEFRKSFLIAALSFHKWNIVHTAKTLGISRRTLQLQMRRAGLEGAIKAEE